MDGFMIYGDSVVFVMLTHFASWMVFVFFE